MQAIRFFMSSNLTVQGLRIKNSPQFNFRFDNCRDVHIESIYITAPPLSPNTDGIHIENSNNVKIYNSVVSNGQSLTKICSQYLFITLPSSLYMSLFVGDDCVSIGSGSYNVDIKNITCGPSHGIRYAAPFVVCIFNV